jgi:ABC-2 type transport system ATP-binding protein
VNVLGFDPALDVRSLKDRIGVCLQATNLPEKVRVYEALEWFSAFYSKRTNCERLLERLQLTEKRNEFYSRLSGGQKQRVALALALVNEPQLIFLDEPTTGLDPQVRLQIHTLIQELRQGSTILLTTHYIEEAERLCDRVAIIDQGKIIAIGTPREIQQQTLGQSRIEVVTEQPMPQDIPQFEDAEKHVVSDDRKLLAIYSTRPARTVPGLVKWIDQQGPRRHPSEASDDRGRFHQLTGRRLRE